MEPPFEADDLEELVVESYNQIWENTTQTMRWLLAHQNPVAMTEAIREAWQASSLRLRDWADSIERVFAWRDEHGAAFGLEVQGVNLPGSPVIQDAPFSGDILQELLAAFDEEVPEVMVQLARAAPGLCVDETGAWALPNCFFERLGYIRRWQREEEFTDTFLDSLRIPDPAYGDYVMEVASDLHGNYFVLGKDRRLHLFDHEKCEFTTCRPTLEELLARYFDDPACLFDWEFLGA